MSIGIKIRRLRESKQMSQSTLAAILNIGQPTLCNIESGDTEKIDFLLMDKVCKEFKVGFDYFIDDKQVNKVKKNEGGVVGCNNGTINNFPENILEQIRLLIEDNKQKEVVIKELEVKLKMNS